MIMLLIKSIIATPNKQFDVAIISWNQHINSHYDYLFILPLYACMIFSNNIALVTNPSPFETGVIYETFSITSFNSTSPHNFPFLSRFISTSITTVPCFNHSFFTNFACPIADTTISACLTSSQNNSFFPLKIL